MKKIVLSLSICLLGLGSAHADQWPHRKPGLWEMTMTMRNSKAPPVTSKFCIDQATESSLMNMGEQMQQKCTKHDVRVSGGTGTVDMICSFGKYTMTSHTDITFTGNAAYHSEVHSQMTPPMPYGGGAHLSTIDAKWTGACPADMRPGDIVMANGMKMHMGAGTK